MIITQKWIEQMKYRVSKKIESHMKKISLKTLGLYFILMMLTIFVTTGCLNDSAQVTYEDEIDIIIDFKDGQLVVGKTILKELQDAGYTLALDNELQQGIDGYIMPSQSYKGGGVMGREDKLYCTYEFLNELRNQTLDYHDCLVSKVTIPYVSQYYQFEYDNAQTLINGVNYRDMTVEEVDNELKDKSTETSEFTYPDGGLAIKNYTLGKNRISVKFDYDHHLVYEVEVGVSHNYFDMIRD